LGDEKMADTNSRVGHYYIDESTLDEMYEVISEGIHPFITLNIVDSTGTTISSVTIPHARFRDVEERADLIEVRSTDCDQTCDECKGIRNTVFISRRSLKKYSLKMANGMHHYVFNFKI
jgi:hypothetical protein